MKYKVKFLDSEFKEFQKLTTTQQNQLKEDYLKIENVSMDAVLTKLLGDKIFEIKTSNLRTLFKYSENQIIIIGVIFVKKTQRTPKEILKLAQKRLKGI